MSDVRKEKGDVYSITNGSGDYILVTIGEARALTAQLLALRLGPKDEEPECPTCGYYRPQDAGGGG